MFRTTRHIDKNEGKHNLFGATYEYDLESYSNWGMDEDINVDERDHEKRSESDEP